MWVTLLFLMVASAPAVVWWNTSAPLVEMDDEHVTFFTGWKRTDRCRIPRSKLLLVSVQKDEREARVLSLLFDGAAVQPLRKFTWTPFLEIKSQEVFISAGYVRGDPEEVAEAWNQAIEARNQTRPAVRTGNL